MNLKLYFSAILLLVFSINSQAQSPCFNGMVAGYPCENIDFWAFVPLNQMGGGSATNDIWGWTDPASGREFALVGKSTGTAFVEITDPGNPDYLGQLPTHTDNSTWRDIKVYENYAFIVSEAGGHGMQVFELTQLLTINSPQIFSESAYYGGFGHSHNIAINEDSGYAYSVGDNTANGGLNIIDISDPLNPTLAGSFGDDGYTHDCQAVNYSGPDEDYAGKEIVIALNADHFTIVNVSDKTDCTMISDTYYEDDGYTHQGWLTKDQKYLIFGDELDELNDITENTRTFVYNVEDLDNPFEVVIYEGPTTAIDHNLYTVGNMVYQSNYRSGLRIVDAGGIEDGNLIERGFFDCYPSNDNPSFDGSWSNYPYFPSGNIVLTGIDEGLFIVRPQIFHLNADVTQVDCATNTAEFVLEVPTELSSTSYTLTVEGLSGNPTATAPSINIPGTTNITVSNISGLEDGETPFQIVLNGDYGQYIVPAVVQTNGPSAPEELSPENGTLLTNLYLNWDDNADVTSYNLIISPNADLSDPVITNTTDLSSYFITDLLNDGEVYYWAIVANDACGFNQSATMNFVFDDETVGVIENSNELNVTVFPNPSNGKFNIAGLIENKDLIITDVTGRIVWSETTEAKELVVNVSNLTKGIYFLQYKESKQLIEKIILE